MAFLKLFLPSENWEGAELGTHLLSVLHRVKLPVLEILTLTLARLEGIRQMQVFYVSHPGLACWSKLLKMGWGGGNVLAEASEEGLGQGGACC